MFSTFRRRLAEIRPIVGAAAALLVLGSPALAADAPKLAPELQARIDSAARDILGKTGVPSASVAIVRDGEIAYLAAYGTARLSPRVEASPAMRYSIGSISKQFTATAILLLAEEGKLSLDDPVSRFLPDLTRANEVTIRELLAHTSGYRDYWPQDYVPPFMRREITAADILDLWAKRPLDFEPGTQWQYSNTGYVIAGVIVEKAAGVPLLQFLATRVFAPLGMSGVVDIDRESLSASDPVGYLRYALGPPRVAPKEGKGWLFAAGELAMTPRDLAVWNVGLIERKLLKPASYREMETEVLLKNGVATGYGLGLDVGMSSGHRMLSHGGEVSGFTASNRVFPDDRAAVTVLTNQDAAEAASGIARKISDLLFADRDAGAAEKRALAVFQGLQLGRIDRALFTDNGNSYFTEQAVADFASSLGPLGKPQGLEQIGFQPRGGMTTRRFDVKFPGRALRIVERDLPDGRIEQYQVMAID
jgi:D-alanyl-D-alanine carboxypeptidase